MKKSRDAIRPKSFQGARGVHMCLSRYICIYIYICMYV